MRLYRLQPGEERLSAFGAITTLLHDYYTVITELGFLPFKDKGHYLYYFVLSVHVLLVDKDS